MNDNLKLRTIRFQKTFFKNKYILFYIILIKALISITSMYLLDRRSIENG